MSQPKVSIIIPVYNVEPYIAECLQSVMRQTYQGPMECLMVDDCGTDKSMDIAERMISEYEGPIEFSVLHHDENKGLSCARNTGMDAAKGDYIYFIDSDDYITDDSISHLVSIAVEGAGKYDVIAGDNDEIGERVNSGKVKANHGFAVSGEEFLRLFQFERCVSGSSTNKLLKYSFLTKYNMDFVPNMVQEDYVFLFRFSCQPTLIYVSNQVTYHYRIRPQSIVHELSDPVKLRTSDYMVWTSIWRYCEKESYNETHESLLHEFAYRYFLTSYQNRLDFKGVFSEFHKEYPYKPLMVWLKSKQNFKWYRSRMMWSLPTPFGYIWLHLKWWKKGVNVNPL